MHDLPLPQKPAWAGPLKGGITQSIINRFLDCPYRFYIWAVLGKEDPDPPKPNLAWGSIFHRGIEHCLTQSNPVVTFTQAQKDELYDVIKHYTNTKYPSSPASFPHSCFQMALLYDDSYKLEDEIVPEVEFEIPYTTLVGNLVTLRGKVDGLGKRIMAEHKCVGYFDTIQSRTETPEDLQLNLYMYVTGIRECIYDKIKIPDTNPYAPQKRTAEQTKHWVERLYHTHYYKEYPISKNRFLWLDQFPVFRTDEEIDTYRRFVIEPHINTICRYWDKVTDPSFNPNDPSQYDELFYIKPIRTFDASRTEKYKCNYYHFLAGQMEFDELQDVEFYAELTQKDAE